MPAFGQSVAPQIQLRKAQLDMADDNLSSVAPPGRTHCDTLMSVEAKKEIVAKDAAAGSLSETMVSSRISALRRIFPDHERLAQTILSQLVGTRRSLPQRATGPAYLLCFTPRSGSSLLGELLGRTGSVGMAEEHFPAAAGAPVPDWMAKCADLNDVFQMLAEQAPAGYFGIKGDLYRMFPLISAGVFAGPRSIFKHIYLTRRDRIGQAISLARAVKTNEWHSYDAPVPDPNLSVEDVLYHLRYLSAMEADWETVFAALRLQPLRLYYEDLVHDRPGAFEKIRPFLNVRWKTDPVDIVSARECISRRHDPRSIRNLRDQF